MKNKSKYLFVIMLLLALSVAGFWFTRGCAGLEERKNEEELLIVTSFYPMYVAAWNIAGDVEGVAVENLSEPQSGCLHDYQLTPQDMILLSEADIFVVNGGGMEGFLTDVAAEYPKLLMVNAGETIFGEEEGHDHDEHKEGSALNDQKEGDEEKAHADHDHGENAHAWMSIPHYMEQVAAIRDGLAEADPEHKELYTENAEAYLAKIEVLRQEMELIMDAAKGEPVVLFHEAFEYLAEDYGMQVAGELNLDEERRVSAGEVADILTAIKTKKIEILLAEDLYGKDLGDTIEEETDCKVYYLDTLVRGDDPKDSWLLGMKQNIEILKAAFRIEG